MSTYHATKFGIRAFHVLCTFVLLVMSVGLSPAAGQSSPALGSIIYVDVDATGSNNGTSWANAYTDLQPALEHAVSGDQVWVAAGTYLPTEEHCGSGERYRSWQLKNGVGVYGGFDPSMGDVNWEDRDWEANVTDLSGDIGVPGDNKDNSYHVFCHPAGLNLDNSAILDGFNIRDGHANGVIGWDNSGGGMINDNGSSPILSNITFTNNSATYAGGGVFNLYSSPRLTHVNFTGNSANDGGGMMNAGNTSSSILNFVTFNNNSATSGGGMENSHSPATLTNITFSENNATSGGGMYNDNAWPTMTNVIFNGNTSTSFGGGMYSSFSSPTLVNVTFSGNNAGNGGAMYGWAGSAALTNITFSGNTAIGSGGAIFTHLLSISLTNVTFFSNSALEGGGIFSDSDTMTLSNCTFSSNAAETEGGAILSQLSTLNLINSILWGDSPAEFNVDPHRTVTYSDIQGGYAGTGNINANPWFVDATNGNLRLLIISPAIDAGDNTAVPPTVITDREGNPRFVDVPIIPDSGNGIPPIADMGAYEVQGNIYFVDVEASGNNDGTSWQDAFTELQPALDAAVGGGKIVVAAGTYYPTVEHCGVDDTRFKSFQMMNGVSIFGGFDPSRGDVNIGDRDWMENETILSGDIGIPGNNADNSYHIFCNSAELNLNGNAILNGFKIISGNSTGSTGGGMVNENASPELTNIIFSGNNEAALANWSSSPMLTNVSFLGNTGDAIINWYSNPRLYNVVFNNNTGRGMFNGESYPTLVNATFYGNSGGGIYNHDSSSTTLTNSIMWRDGTFEIFNDWGSSNVTYSDIQGGFDGEGNIKLYPRFVSPSSGDFHLMHSSPCIDAGNNLTPGLPDFDFEGDARIMDGDNDGIATVDMGVDEAFYSVHYDVKLPMMMMNKPIPGIYGMVTMNGQPAGGVLLYLRFFDGSNWSTADTTVTDNNGEYEYLDVSPLQPGQVYYVRYVNETYNDSRLWSWWTRNITSYYAGESVLAGNFDLADVKAYNPYPGATVSFPVTFSWGMRSGSPTDSYELELFTPDDSWPNYYSNPLGHVGQFTLSGLPYGFDYGDVYGWYMGVYSPDGGYGEAYYYFEITFAGGKIQIIPVDRTQLPQPLSRADPERPARP